MPEFLLRATGYLCLLVAGLSLATGCANGARDWLAPHDARDAMERIDENYARIRGPLTASAVVSARFRDASGRTRRFVGQSATIIFESPRCLYFDIKSPAGSVARIGANDERYWLWIDMPDVRKLWWGTWEALEDGRATPLPVPPNDLLDALLLRTVPHRLHAGTPPLLKVDVGGRRLHFHRLDARGWPYVAREMVLDRSPPHLVREIIDRDEDGQVRMHAVVSSYRRVDDAGPDAPYTPRRYVVRWPAEDAEMRLDLRTVQYYTRPLPICDFPSGWRFESESLDRFEAFDLSGEAE